MHVRDSHRINAQKWLAIEWTCVFAESCWWFSWFIIVIFDEIEYLFANLNTQFADDEKKSYYDTHLPNWNSLDKFEIPEFRLCIELYDEIETWTWRKKSDCVCVHAHTSFHSLALL